MGSDEKEKIASGFPARVAGRRLSRFPPTDGLARFSDPAGIAFAGVDLGKHAGWRRRPTRAIVAEAGDLARVADRAGVECARRNRREDACRQLRLLNVKVLAEAVDASVPRQCRR